jgi:tetrahydromethanopterin S-methyltransferase subunit F
MNIFRKILVEVISVVFAVLLALGLNHWREEKANEALAEKALQNIIIEIKSNIENIDSDVEEYEVIYDTLVARKKRLTNGTKTNMSLSYNHPILSSSAWKIANTTGAVKDMDIEVMMDLSDLYTFQEIFQKNGFEYFSSFTSLDAQKKENELAFLDSFLKQISILKSWGKSLSNGYRDFIINHEEKLIQVVHPDSLKIE